MISRLLAMVCVAFPLAAQAEEGMNAHEGHQHQASSLEDEVLGKETVYTCPMHPQITSNEAGSCPICGMDLVAIEDEPSSEGPQSSSATIEAVHVDKATRQLAGIATVVVKSAPARRHVRAVGTLAVDTGRLSRIAAYVSGRVEKVYADYVGVVVEKGKHLAEVYSPELYQAQVEYLEAKRSLPKLARSARQKLTELGMSPDQLAALDRQGRARSTLTLNAPMGGTVIAKSIVAGQYVSVGQVLYEVADLSSVWLMLDVFPEDALAMRLGQKVEATLRSLPGETFSGRISFISPTIDPRQGTLAVRAVLTNPSGKLRVGDLADAHIRVPAGGNGAIYDAELAGKYVSPMHPQHLSDEPGQCPICGMEMLPASHFGFADAPIEEPSVITLPRDAVLHLGDSSAVYVEEQANRFAFRKVSIGPEVEGGRLIITDGLKVGEVVAASGVFLLDSQAQIRGKTSLMRHTQGTQAPEPGAAHNH